MLEESQPRMHATSRAFALASSTAGRGSAAMIDKMRKPFVTLLRAAMGKLIDFRIEEHPEKIRIKFIVSHRHF